jgi:hypothetical protein
MGVVSLSVESDGFFNMITKAGYNNPAFFVEFRDKRHGGCLWSFGA